MTVQLESPCKINLLLNILGRRADGFHDLETVFLPVPLSDRLEFARQGQAIQLSCSDPNLPTGPENLIHRAADSFLRASGIQSGIRVHVEKRIPVEAGLGGGSSNAARTLVGLNQLFGDPLADRQLEDLAAQLGSDVNFFLHNSPAVATGRGEKVEWVEPFEILRGKQLILIRPGFGVSTAWAYRSLGEHPQALNGKPGRAARLVDSLRAGQLGDGLSQLYNSLEVPVLKKYPILALYQEFLREKGALAALMSGSGSTTFALAENRNVAEQLIEAFKSHFAISDWICSVALEA